MGTASINPDTPGLCPGCFSERGKVNPYPHCGEDAKASRPANALPAGTALDGKFLIGRVLGKPGRFGISWRPTAPSPWRWTTAAISHSTNTSPISPAAGCQSAKRWC